MNCYKRYEKFVLTVLLGGDLNNDGFLDLVIANCKNKPADAVEPTNSVFYNKGNDNNWLKIKLEGTTSNRSAIGAKVWAKATIEDQSVSQLRYISAQSGYAGQNSLIVHFGLKDAQKVDSLTIEWPNGEVQYLKQIFANQQIKVVENGVITSNFALEKNSFELNIFPNPAALNDSSLTLKIEGVSLSKEMLSIRLFDTVGKLVFKKEIEKPSIKNRVLLPINQLNIGAGTYQLVVQQGNSQVSKTLVIQ